MATEAGSPAISQTSINGERLFIKYGFRESQIQNVSLFNK